MRYRLPRATTAQHGAALLMILIAVVALAALLISALKSNPQIERDKVTADVLAQAKDALIGYAATYRDSHPNEVFGYLPCPDTDNDGFAENSCGSVAGTSVIGRLPWRTLGLPPLRDSSGECLWYAISGTYKNSPASPINFPMNWDSYGQFVISDADGTVLAGTAAESRVAAVVFSPRGAIGSQDRTPVGTTECGGNTTIAAYLDGGDPIYAGTEPAAGTATSLTVATAASIANGTNNDWALWITPGEVWERIKKRSDFATDITNLLADIRDQAAMNASCVATTVFDPPLPGSIIEAGVSGKNVGMAPAITQICIPADALKRMAVFNHWRNNALYATCPSATAPCLTVNGASCAGAVIFSGERVAGRTRPSTAAADYLEGNNLTAFTTAATVLSGAGPYAWNTSSQDIALCIPAVGGGAWPFEYPTQWAGVPALDPATVAVGGGTDTSGTSGNDDVNITGNLSTWVDLKSGNDELLVTGNFTSGGSFGAGDDIVKVGGNLTGAIDMGSGDDYVDVGGDSTGYIDVGSGSDKVRIGGDALASITFGSGDDELHILGSATGYIDAGEGNDKIRIEGSMTAYTNLGGGNDLLIIFGDMAGASAGSGDDVILVGGDATNWLDLGSGNDYLEVLGNCAGLDAGGEDDIIKITGNATNSISLNAGDDYLRVGGTITWIDGGSGTDRIYLTHYTTADCATLLTSKISTNVEHVKVSNGMCRGTDFTFP